MFLHGWGGGIVSFEGVAKTLGARGYRCVVPDLYGFGNSPINAPKTLYDYADAVSEVMGEVGTRGAILVGHSFGGRVAALMAAKRYAYVTAVVLTDAAGLKPRPTFRRFVRTMKFRIKKTLGFDTSDCGSPDYRALDEVMKATFKNVVNFYLDDMLSDIKVPALIVWGKEDKETPPYMARRFARGIADSGLVTLDGGHFCYLDSFGEYTAVLSAFAEGMYGDYVGDNFDGGLYGGGDIAVVENIQSGTA